MPNRRPATRRTRTTYTGRIAPRLAEGTRVTLGSRLPPSVKEGLRAIAKSENRSMSWTVEEIVLDYFGFRRPKYAKRRH